MTEARHATAQPLLDRVDLRSEELSREVTEQISREITEYGASERDDEFWEDVRSFGALQISGAMSAARRGGEASPEALEVIRAATVRRVAQGVPLESILQAFRLGHQIVWNAVVEEAQLIEGGQSVAIHLTLPFMRYVDAVCTCIAEAYLGELHSASVRADRAARDLLEVLLAGELADGRRETALAAAASAGIDLDLDRGHQVAVFTADGRTDDLRDLSAALARRLRDSFVLSVIRHDELILVTDPAADDPSALGRAISRHVLPRADEDLRAGVGLICAGPAGYAESTSQARSALDVAGPGQPITGLADIPLVEYLTARPDSAARAMVPSAVHELATGRKAMDQALRQTLFAYIANGMNVIRTAKSLPAHPNTVSYRLGRLSERTGYDHRDPSQLVELAMGLRVAMRNRQPPPFWTRKLSKEEEKRVQKT